MRAAVPAVLTLATPAAAAPHGPGCQLSTRECVQVARELAIGAELDAEDARTFGFGLSPYDNTMALLDRSKTRTPARLRQLPTAIGNEVGRLMMCASADDRAQNEGIPNPHRECR